MEFEDEVPAFYRGDDLDEDGMWAGYLLPPFSRFHKEEAHREPFLQSKEATFFPDSQYQENDECCQRLFDAFKMTHPKVDLMLWKPYCWDESIVLSLDEELLAAAQPFGLKTADIKAYSIHSAILLFEEAGSRGGYNMSNQAQSCAEAFNMLLKKAMACTKQDKAARFSALIHLAYTCLTKSNNGMLCWASYCYEPADRAKLLRRLASNIKKLWPESDATLGLVDVAGQSARKNVEAFLTNLAGWIEHQFEEYEEVRNVFPWMPSQQKRKPRAAKTALASVAQAQDQDQVQVQGTIQPEASPADAIVGAARARLSAAERSSLQAQLPTAATSTPADGDTYAKRVKRQGE